jgi:predicted kinase
MGVSSKGTQEGRFKSHERRLTCFFLPGQAPDPPDAQERKFRMLVIFGGLPGTGKSTLALRLAGEAGAVYLRIDTIERAMVDANEAVSVGERGYLVAYAVSEDNLRLGHTVVADSVNPLQITRTAWRNVAERAGVNAVEIEVVCSDRAEHRHRIETRVAPIPVTWQEVVERNFEPWAGEHVRIDTAGQKIEQSLAALRQALPVELRR